jgi:hypothetical protein
VREQRRRLCSWGLILAAGLLVAGLFGDRAEAQPTVEPKIDFRDIYAAPFSAKGPEVMVYSAFGDHVGCTLSIVESNTGGPVTLEVKSSKDDEWKTYTEGKFVEGQVIRVRANSAGTGGYVRIKITS